MHTGQCHVKMKADRDAASTSQGMSPITSKPPGPGKRQRPTLSQSRQRSQPSDTLILCFSSSEPQDGRFCCLSLSVGGLCFSRPHKLALEKEKPRDHDNPTGYLYFFFRDHLPQCTTALKKMMLLEKRGKKSCLSGDYSDVAIHKCFQTAGTL